MMSDISELKGLTLARVQGLDVGSDKVYFVTTCDYFFKMHHHQDCCESVRISNIDGDVDDLIGEEILLAEEVKSIDDMPEIGSQICIYEQTDYSHTWTLYRLATKKGSVLILWLGESSGCSSGCYSESVDFEELMQDK